VVSGRQRFRARPPRHANPKTGAPMIELSTLETACHALSGFFCQALWCIRLRAVYNFRAYSRGGTVRRYVTMASRSASVIFAYEA
jgi:hypothetical protein